MADEVLPEYRFGPDNSASERASDFISDSGAGGLHFPRQFCRLESLCLNN
jgi:hypothetical protein